MEIGVQELRDNLSRYLAEVQRGKTITITRYGKPIARMVPVRELSTLERLVAEGKVTPPRAVSVLCLCPRRQPDR